MLSIGFHKYRGVSGVPEVDWIGGDQSLPRTAIRGPCQPELVDLHAQNVPARSPAPTNSHWAIFVTGQNFLATATRTEICSGVAMTVSRHSVLSRGFFLKVRACYAKSRWKFGATDAPKAHPCGDRVCDKGQARMSPASGTHPWHQMPLQHSCVPS